MKFHNFSMQILSFQDVSMEFQDFSHAADEVPKRASTDLSYVAAERPRAGSSYSS